MPILVEVLYNDDDFGSLYCTNSKERINFGQKYANLIVEGSDGEVEKIPYLLENLPLESEYEV